MIEIHHRKTTNKQTFGVGIGDGANDRIQRYHTPHLFWNKTFDTWWWLGCWRSCSGSRKRWRCLIEFETSYGLIKWLNTNTRRRKWCWRTSCWCRKWWRGLIIEFEKCRLIINQTIEYLVMVEVLVNESMALEMVKVLNRIWKVNSIRSSFNKLLPGDGNGVGKRVDGVGNGEGAVKIKIITTIHYIKWLFD